MEIMLDLKLAFYLRNIYCANSLKFFSILITSRFLLLEQRIVEYSDLVGLVAWRVSSCFHNSLSPISSRCDGLLPCRAIINHYLTKNIFSKLLWKYKETRHDTKPTRSKYWLKEPPQGNKQVRSKQLCTELGQTEVWKDPPLLTYVCVCVV